MIHKKGLGSTSSQKLIEPNPTENPVNTKDDPQNLSQLLSHRDNEISMKKYIQIT